MGYGCEGAFRGAKVLQCVRAWSVLKWNLQYTASPLPLTSLNVWLPYPFMWRYPSGVPRSEKRKETWCVVSGRREIKSQNMSARAGA